MQSVEAASVFVSVNPLSTCLLQQRLSTLQSQCCYPPLTPHIKSEATQLPVSVLGAVSLRDRAIGSWGWAQEGPPPPRLPPLGLALWGREPCWLASQLPATWGSGRRYGVRAEVRCPPLPRAGGSFPGAGLISEASNSGWAAPPGRDPGFPLVTVG